MLCPLQIYHQLADLLAPLLNVHSKSDGSNVLFLADLRMRTASALKGNYEAPHGTERLSGYLQTKHCGPIQSFIDRYSNRVKQLLSVIIMLRL